MMNDWFRSLTVLGAGFVGVVAFTLGLAMVIVPGQAVSSGTPDATPATSETGDVPSTARPITAEEGGTLSISGDVAGTFTLTTVLTDGRYGLAGDDARIFFTADPPAIEQLNLGGLSFFPEPDDCTITPGVLNAAIGVATAELDCAEIADVRGNGIVTIEGTIRLSAQVMDMRGDLPATGGSLEVGGETLAFTDAVLYTGPRPIQAAAGRYRLELLDADSGTRLAFTYDLDIRELALSSVGRDGRNSDVADDACTVNTREVGMLGPRVILIELSLECPDVDVPGLGPVPISGAIFVEQSEAAR